MVIANITGYMPSLDLFTISNPNGDTGQMSTIWVARLWLPGIDMDYYPVANVKFSNHATKNDVVCRNLQIDDAASYIKPFTSSLDNLIYVLVKMQSSENEEQYAFVVHSSTLL